jgi:epoxide hydrolase-like predicted phosphatase
VSQIKAIGFDYGGVIGGVGRIGGNFTKQVSEILGMSEEEYRNVYFSMNDKINTGEIDNWRAFWKLFVEKIGQPDKYEAVAALSDEANKYATDIDQNMIALIDELRANGYKTGLLSNATAEMGRKLRELGVDKHFDVFHISSEIKMMKPDPNVFMNFAEALHVQPNEMVFIDDAEKSLSTATDVGFVPILFSSYDQLKGELSKLNIV